MKTCFKCRFVLPLEQFYRHPRMGDGHLGKCKACTRKDSEARRKLKEATDLQWVLAERERHRVKANKHRTNSVPAKRDAASLRKYRKSHPLKCAAHCITNNAIRAGKLQRKTCEVCGAKAQAHHDDYHKPLEVRWLCPKHHAEHHRKQREQAIIASFNQ